MPKTPSNVITIEDEECLHGLGNNFYYISQILQQRTLSNGRVQIFVSWEGWPETYNSWVYKDTMMPADIFKSIDSTSIFTQESNKSKSKNNKNKQVKQESKVKHEDTKIQSKQVVQIQSIQISQLGNSGKMAIKNRRKKHDKTTQGKEKGFQVNMQNKDIENGSKKLKKKKEQVKLKIDKNAIKAKKLSDKIRHYTQSDSYSQNQISETRRKFAINFQKKISDGTHQAKDAEKINFISLPTTQQVISSRTPHELDESLASSKQILNKKSKEDKNDSLLINIGDISDVDLSKISLQSEASFLCSGQSSSNKILKQRKQKKYVDKFCPWKRFKIDPNQNKDEKIKKVNLMQSQKCTVQNSNLKKKQLMKQKEKEEKKQVEQKNYCKQEQKGSSSVINSKQISFNDKKSDEKSKIIQTTNNSEVSKKKQEEDKEIISKNGNTTISPDSLLIDNLNLTKPTCQPKNCELNSVSNLLSNLQVTQLQHSIAEIGLKTSKLLKNNQTSLLIDSSFCFCKNVPSKSLKDTNTNNSFSLLIDNTSNEPNNDERKTMRVTKKEQQIQEEPTSIQEQATKRNISTTDEQQNKKDQLMDKYDTPLLPDEQQQKIQYDGVYEDEAKNKIHRSNKAIDFYFRRQYPQLFNQSCQKSNSCQIQETFNKQDQIIDLDEQFDRRAQRQKKQNLKFDRVSRKQEQDTSKDSKENRKSKSRKKSNREQKKVKNAQRKQKEEENKQTKIEQQQQFESNEQLKSMLQQQNTIIFCEPAVNSDVYDEQQQKCEAAAQSNKSMKNRK